MDAPVTRLLRALQRVHARVRATGDRGTTMIELFVAMIIMSIAGSIFVGGVVTLSRATNQAQAVTSSATNNNQAYQALDKMVRYAAAISTPDVSSGTKDWYVELQDTTSGTEVCIQLRVDIASQQLQRRTWSATNIATLTAWVPIASGITNGAAAAGPGSQPFFLEDVTATSQHQELTITMVSSSGPANGRVTSRSRFGLTALNSTVPPPSGAICQQAGRP